MGTRSMIGLLHQDGSITAIYCHWDGNPKHHGPILLGNYQTEASLAKLLSLGNLSSLGSELGEKHDPDKTRVKNWCAAYGRDFPGDPDGLHPGNLAMKCADTNAYESLSIGHSAEYAYLLQPDGWMICDLTLSNGKAPPWSSLDLVVSCLNTKSANSPR